ncbi:MAG TPA: acyltransferase [Opitutaceae bacterium]|nr:acyltransferase [Opitutaceae bacterium]
MSASFSHRLRQFAATFRVWRFRRRAGVQAGRGLRLLGAAPVVSGGGQVKIADHVSIDSRLFPVRLTALAGGTLTIGRGTFINRGAALAAAQSVRIGENCLLGEWVSVLDTDFHPVHADAPIAVAPVAIGRNVWLGNRATVLRGVTIGDHAVIGAGAVVTRDVPARAIVVGNPARVVGTVRCDDPFRRGSVPFPS